MAENNLRQALVPVGADDHPADPRHRARARSARSRSTARQGDLRRARRAARDEGHARARRAARPAAPRRARPSVIVSRTLRTWGESESGLNERLDPVIDRARGDGQPHARVPGQRVGGHQGAPHRQGRRPRRGRRALLDRWDARGPRRARRPSCSASTTTRWSRWCSSCCASAGCTLGLAESVTGGLVGGRITNVPGASEVFRGVDRQLRQRGEVRRARRARGPGGQRGRGRRRWPCGARRVLGSRRGARRSPAWPGPTEQDGMPVGTLCVGHRHRRRRASPARCACPGQRDQMRQMSVISALDLLRRRTAARVVGSTPRLRSSMERAAGFYPVGCGFESYPRHTVLFSQGLGLLGALATNSLTLGEPSRRASAPANGCCASPSNGSVRRAFAPRRSAN